MSRSLYVLPVTLLVVAALAGCGHQSAPNASAEQKDGKPAPGPVVQAASVRIGTIEEVLTATGTAMALRNQEATVTPSVAGILDKLPVRFGEQVRKGQVIGHLSVLPVAGQIQQAQATLGQSEVQVRQARVNALQQHAQSRTAVLQAQAAVSGAKATLAGAQATLLGDEAAVRNAQENLTRAQKLFQEGLVAQKDVETAQLGVRTAEAQAAAQRQAVEAQRQTVAGQSQAVDAARAAMLQDLVKQQDIQVAEQQVRNAQGAVTTSRSQLALYTLHAPVTGQVTSIGAAVGENVDTTTKLMTIANLSELQLQVSVPNESAHRVHVGQQVRFTVANLPHKAFATVVQKVGTQVDPSSNTVAVYGVVGNAKRQLRDDTTVKAEIVTGRHVGALLVPKNAVLFDASGAATVVTVGTDQIAHLKNVKIGYQNGNTIEILSGLSQSDRVVTVGNYGLTDGARVQVSGQGPPSSSKETP